MLKVRVDGDVRFALRKLKRLVEKDGIQKEMKKHEFYEKPSEQRRRAKLRSIKSAQKAQEEKPKHF